MVRWGVESGLRMTGAALVAMALTVPGVSGQSRAPDAFTSLVEAERAFAAIAVDQNASAAFLAVLAEDGLVFGPKPQNGRVQQLLAPFPADFALAWDPRVAAVSRSGDLGFTSGPFTAGTRGQAPGGFGTFSTVWRRSASGTWELLADLGWGHAHDEDLNARPSVRPISPAPGPPATWSHAEAEAALAARMSEVHRVLDGDAPESDLAGKVLPWVRVSGSPGGSAEGHAALISKHSEGTARVWNVVTWGFSSAFDMAFVVSRYEPAAGGQGPSGSVLEVWSADASGWQLMMMMAEDDPPPPGR